MNMRLLLLVLLSLCLMPALRAQPCSTGNSCFDAPLMCGNVLDGYQGSTGGPNDITQPDIFCGIIENNQWIRFVACETTVQLELLVSNCNGTLTGSGLQAEIFETADCSNFTSVSDCFNPATEMDGTLTASNLTPGNIYYLMVDGWASDRCDYQINVISGVDTEAPDPAIISEGQISGPTSVCPGSQSVYSVDPPVCSDQSQSGCPLPDLSSPFISYNWNVPPGATIVGEENATSITVQWGNTSGPVSVVIDEQLPSDCGCDWSCPATVPPLDVIVNVEPINSDTLPTVYLCDGESYEYCGVTYSSTINAICSDDCVYAEIQPIIVVPTSTANLGLQPLCSGECFQINGESFCSPGAYSSTYLDENVCIITNFELQEIIVDGFFSADGVLTPTVLSVELVGMGSSNNGNVTYQWVGPDITPLNMNEQNPVVSLPGAYTVTITDIESGCVFVFTTQVLYQENDCNLPVPPSDTCIGAPLLCGDNLDGYCSFTDNFGPSIPGNLASMFCFGIENNAWLRFIPCEPTIEFSLEVPDCNVGTGIEAGVFQTDDCDNFSLLSGCLSIDLLSTDTFTVGGLIPGEIYYLMIDGQSGAHCEWAVDIIAGISTEAISFEQVSEAQVFGAQQVCQGNIVTYTAIPPVCLITGVDNCPYQSLLDSLDYEWSVPPGAAIVSGQGTAQLVIEWQWGDGGSVSINIESAINDENAFCSTANGCGDNASIDVIVNFTSTTLDPVYICEGECYEFCGMTYCETTDAICADSCSQLVQPIIQITPQSTDLGVFDLCAGDCYEYEGISYCEEGVYEFLTSNGPCVDTTRFEIILLEEPRFYLSEVIEDCDAFGTTYNVVFEIVDGVPPFYINGELRFDNFFQSDPLINGEEYYYEISQTASCSDSTIIISGSKSCECQTLAGTMQQDLLVDCEGELISATHDGNDFLDGDDAYEYILHEGPDSALVNPLAINLTGSFEFMPEVMEYGQTYYISYVAGNAIDGGFVDLNALCLRVSLGQPVVFYPRPIANAGLDSIIDCNTPVIQLNATIEANTAPSVGFAWNGPNGFSVNDSLNPFVNLPGTYTLTVMDSITGCSSSDDIFITPDFAAPDINGGGGILDCYNPQIQLEGSSSTLNVTYHWMNPSGISINEEDPMVNEPGMYILTTTGSNGCTSSIEIEVENNIIIPVINTEGGTLTCSSPSVHINANTSASDATYLWQGPDDFETDNPQFETEIAGAYVLTVMNVENGCINDTTVIVEDIVAYPIAEAGPGLILDCNSPALNLRGQNSSTGNNIIYTWMGPGGFISYEIDPLIDQVGVYSLVVTDTTNNCAESDEVTITQNFEEPIILEALGGSLNCNVEEILLEGITTNPEDVFLWVTPDSDTIAAPLINATVPGNYQFIAIGPNGCYSTEITYVEDNFYFPAIEVSASIIDCTTEESLLSVTSDISNVSFEWTGPEGFQNSSAQTSTSLPGIYSIIVTNNESNCQTDTIVEVLHDVEFPIAEAGTANQLTCSILEIQLDGSESDQGEEFDFLWNNSENLLIENPGSLEPTVENSGWYQLQVTNTLNGCISLDSVLVTEFEDIPTALNYELQGPDCYGEDNGSIIIENSVGGIPPFTYAFNGSDFSLNNFVPGLQAGEYEISIQDGNGCIFDEIVYLEEPPLVEIELGEDLTVNLGQEITLSPSISIPESDVFSINWQSNLGESSSENFEWLITAIYSSTYSVVVTDYNNCRDTASIDISVNREFPVYIPNAFSPNGDGENDIFFVHAGSSIPIIKTFRIFDRWGELVFRLDDVTPNDPGYGWDGTLKDGRMQSAVFVYYVEVESFEGSVGVYKGDVVLMR